MRKRADRASAKKPIAPPKGEIIARVAGAGRGSRPAPAERAPFARSKQLEHGVERRRLGAAAHQDPHRRRELRHLEAVRRQRLLDRRGDATPCPIGTPASLSRQRRERRPDRVDLTLQRERPPQLGATSTKYIAQPVGELGAGAQRSLNTGAHARQRGIADGATMPRRASCTVASARRASRRARADRLRVDPVRAWPRPIAPGSSPDGCRRTTRPSARARRAPRRRGSSRAARGS